MKAALNCKLKIECNKVIIVFLLHDYEVYKPEPSKAVNNTNVRHVRHGGGKRPMSEKDSTQSDILSDKIFGVKLYQTNL